MPASTPTAERLAALEARLAQNTTLLTEIHLSVVGNGSAGSSLRERVSSLETAHQQESSWRYRGVNAGAIAVVSAALAWLTHALTTASIQHP